MVSAVLARADFAVETCRDVDEALPHLQSQEFDAIVLAMDSSAPARDAAMLEHLQQADRPPCVVLLSAGPQPRLDNVVSDLVRARLRKPFDIAELVAVVRECFPT